MHEVRVNEAEIAGAFEAVAEGGTAAAGVAPGAAVVEVAGGGAEGWRPATRLVASVLALKVCPAWEVPADVQQQWADALAECADQLMPGGLGNIDAWGPWGKLAFASGLWLMAGFDPATLKLKPTHQVIDQAPAGDTPDGAPVVNGGGFKTDA